MNRSKRAAESPAQQRERLAEESGVDGAIDFLEQFGLLCSARFLHFLQQPTIDLTLARVVGAEAPQAADLGLPDAVNAAEPLLQAIGVPGQVVIDHRMCAALVRKLRPTRSFNRSVTESLTTDLSRISGAFVIAPNTAFAHREKPVDVRQIGRDLNVCYVLEGSVQRSGERLRVNVQLIEAETGAHVWADRFDKPVAELFGMQDEIVARIANELSAQIVSVEAPRAENSSNPDLLDYLFQGYDWINRGINPESIAKARKCFERARAIDPDNVDAILGLVLAEVVSTRMRSFDRDSERLASVEALTLRALAVVGQAKRFANETPCASNTSTILAKSESERVRRSTL